MEMSHCSALDIATAYGLYDQGVGVRVPIESRIFNSSHHPDRLWGSHNLLSIGYKGIFPWGVKRQGREADQPPSNTEVKKTWIYTSTPPYVFIA
jgi:hypothetical protein